MEQKLDFRIQKTYMALLKAFYELLETVSFEEITVSMLCEKAMVRRATFYKHFADKYEFYTFFIRQIQNDFNSSLVKSVEEDSFQSYYLRIADNIIEFMVNHEKIVTQILESSVQVTLIELLSEQLIEDLSSKIKCDIKKGISFPAPANTIASYYIGALMFTIRFWLMDKNRVSKDKLLEEISSISKGVIE